MLESNPLKSTCFLFISAVVVLFSFKHYYLSLSCTQFNKPINIFRFSMGYSHFVLSSYTKLPFQYFSFFPSILFKDSQHDLCMCIYFCVYMINENLYLFFLHFILCSYSMWYHHHCHETDIWMTHSLIFHFLEFSRIFIHCKKSLLMRWLRGTDLNICERLKWAK